jgi:hypothetical protein
MHDDKVCKQKQNFFVAFTVSFWNWRHNEDFFRRKKLSLF